MNDLEKLMMEDAEGLNLPDNYDLMNISELAQHQKELERLIGSKETELAELNRRLRHVSESALPAAMQAVGMTEFRLADGSKVTIRSDVFASIRADKIAEAVAWLDGAGLGGIVKDEVRVNFGRGDTEKAKQMILFAEENLGVSASEKLSVHPGTLKATVKDMRGKGVEFPEEFFSIADVTRAIIK